MNVSQIVAPDGGTILGKALTTPGVTLRVSLMTADFARQYMFRYNHSYKDRGQKKKPFPYQIGQLLQFLVFRHLLNLGPSNEQFLLELL